MYFRGEVSLSRLRGLPPRATQPVPLVLAQLRVVRAYVDNAGEHAGRVETRGGDVEVEFSDGDAHAVHA